MASILYMDLQRAAASVLLGIRDWERGDYNGGDGQEAGLEEDRGARQAASGQLMLPEALQVIFVFLNRILIYSPG